MCRMLAVRAAPEERRAVLTAFQSQAAASHTGPGELRSHRDGWGIVGPVGRRIVDFGRSIADASADPSYEEAVARAATADPDGFVLAHVRNASVGARTLANTHPFVRDGWAFAHNGTVHGLEAPEGWVPEGDTDSERFFLHLLAANRPGVPMGGAIRTVVSRIDRTRRYTSLTFLLTDGRQLFAYRGVGPDPEECGTLACAAEHYALARVAGPSADVVLQEPGILGPEKPVHAVPDGALLHVAPDGGAREIRVLERPSALVG